jgi:predicted CDP-diglyceride synthetase/phosphatidate cytidylyltransferase
MIRNTEAPGGLTHSGCSTAQRLIRARAWWLCFLAMNLGKKHPSAGRMNATSGCLSLKRMLRTISTIHLPQERKMVISFFSLTFRRFLIKLQRFKSQVVWWKNEDSFIHW